MFFPLGLSNFWVGAFFSFDEGQFMMSAYDVFAFATTVPLAAAKLGCPRDAFQKGFQKISFLSLLKGDDILLNPATTKDRSSCYLFLKHKGH